MAGKLDVVVVAAGRSTRMRGVDKVFAPVLGMPLLAYCLESFERSPLVERVAVVVAEASLENARRLVKERRLTKSDAVVSGGARRQDSVRRGIESLAGVAQPGEWIAVHDGARPFVDDSILERAVVAVQATGAAIAAVPVRDTIKEVGADRAIVTTPPRGGLWAAQTPQVFRRDLLLRAHQDVTADVTDDASMVEQAGGRVVVFEGSPWNIKVTTPEDLAIAEAIASRLRAGARTPAPAQSPAGMEGEPRALPPDRATRRHGTGFDGHRLVAGGPLRIGGLDVPFESRLEGHSDGDVLLHAVASAVLGGAGLGDLGRHFPSSDPSLKGVDSRVLLQRTVALAGRAGWLVEFVDATIIAQRPKLASYLDAIGRTIAETLGLEPGQVNVKATSTDHVGAIGQGEGIAAQAIATVRAAER